VPCFAVDAEPAARPEAGRGVPGSPSTVERGRIRPLHRQPRESESPIVEWAWIWPNGSGAVSHDSWISFASDHSGPSTLKQLGGQPLGGYHADPVRQ
jgi:hypothetical protein